MMCTRRFPWPRTVALLAAVLGACSTARADDWPQFLGPERNGISAETGLLTDWPADGPPELWRIAGGEGMSGLAIRDGRLCTLVQAAGRQWVVCHDALSGERQWKRDVAPAYRNAMGDGPRATPALALDAVYVFTGKGNAIAADGKLFLSTMAGELVVVRPSPEKYNELGRKTILGTTRQAPALANGRLYLRDDAEIVCLDVRRP